MKRYIDYFFSLRCIQDVLPFFGNNGQSPYKRAPKELTESIACYKAALDILKLDPQEAITAIVVGDGVRPRTAGLLSHLTKWDCVAIDPKADLKWWLGYTKEREELGCPIERLTVYGLQAEHAKIHCAQRRAVIFMPHAHCSVANALRVPYEYTRLDVIVMPCCTQVEQKYLEKRFALEHQLFTYVDVDVWSPKNTIHVWQKM